MDILSITITDSGDITIHPGEGFGDEHCDLLVKAHAAVRESLR